MEGFKNEFYASAVIKNKPELIDGVEVNGVIYCGEPDHEGRRPVCVDNDAPEFFSAYVRFKDGHACSVADTGTHAECSAWARQLAASYQEHGWTFTDVFAAAHH